MNPGLRPWAGMSDALGVTKRELGERVTNVKLGESCTWCTSLFSGQRPVPYQPRANALGSSSRFSSCRPTACFITSFRLVQPLSIHYLKPYMPQSLSQVILHIVFSTKERRPWLDPEIRPRMHGYLATVCRDCECQAYRVGGTADHVHIAARLARSVSQADLLEKIKKTSSAWIKQQGN